MSNITMDTEHNICTQSEATSHFPEHFTFCVMLSMIGCAVFVQASSMFKIVMLFVMTAGYLSVVELVYVNLFDNRDLLVRVNSG